MATLTTLEDNKGGPWCVRVGLIRAEDLPKSNVLSNIEHHRLVTVCNRTVKNSKVKVH
jgi:hypothetical protein